MSRSNPTINQPNPSTRWFEWDGANGAVRYYDKEAKKNVEVDDGFTFILLDQLSTVKGWHERSKSGIYSNEVRDMRLERILVKSFKGGDIAEGFYKDIKDTIIARGGYYVQNCYIAWKDENDHLRVGSIQFAGAPLSLWMEFAKANRKAIYEQAIQIKGFDQHERGSGKKLVEWKTPRFYLKRITEETDEAAKALDKELQDFLKGYFARKATQQAPADNDGGEGHPADREEHPADRESHHTDAELAHEDDPDVPF